MFKVVLTNGLEDLELLFRVRETNIAQKWISELGNVQGIYENNRFSNWNNDKLINDLNSLIDIINNYDSTINKKVSATVNQQDLNYLHKFFEDLRGEIKVGTPWFNSAPNNVKDAVQKFNILIHQLESSLRTKNKHPTLVITFKGGERKELTEDDMKHFTYKWKQNTVYINYCHVGKTVLDVFKDQDNIAEGVRPQTHYSADFMIKFGPAPNLMAHLVRTLMIKLWLMKRKFSFKNLNLGMIPVADLVGSVDFETLRKFNTVKAVTCIR
jgi:hypothetical protein